MTRRSIGIGMVGYGGMARAHSYAYTVAPLLGATSVEPQLVMISGRTAHGVERAAGQLGFGAWTSDWHELIGDPRVELVDICTPPGSHREIAEAAAKAGKAVHCEKPLAADYFEARAAQKAVEAVGAFNAVGFNYRMLPAVSLMKRMVDEGAVGKVRLWRATFATDEFADPATPFDWRFHRASGGSTISDLGTHLIDMALWMVGAIDSVCAQSSTFVSERPDPGSTGPGRRVDVDDASSALIRFDSGAHGVLDVSRVTARRPCDFSVEICGEHGTLFFDYPRLNEL